MLFNSIFRNVNVTLLCITNTLTMLYASKVFNGGGGGMEGEWGTWPPLSEFSGSAPGWLASAVKTDRGNVTGVPGHLVI